jgi:U4/U6.U5 tri-snRNP component SNU23
MEKATESVYKNSPGVEFRRKWDKEDYERLAKERYEKRKLERERRKEKPTGLLKAREHTIDLGSNVGKTQVVASVRAAGFHCEICRYTVKDSLSYYDHLNSPRHLRQLGMGEQTERATLEQVKERLSKFSKLRKTGSEAIPGHHSPILSTSQATSDTFSVTETEGSMKKPKLVQGKEQNRADEIDAKDDTSIDIEADEIERYMGFRSFAKKTI